MNENLMKALCEIAEGSLPDQPVGAAGDERVHALRWIGHLRAIALRAIQTEEAKEQ